MSKHNNNYRNYNQYSNNNNKPAAPASDAVAEEVIEKTEVTETADAVAGTEVTTESEAAIETEVEPEVTEESSNPVIGVVTGCAKLNVRSAANVDADIVCTIDEGSEVEIDKDNSTSDFYKVYSAAGFEGYCMKKFITVK